MVRFKEESVLTLAIFLFLFLIFLFYHDVPLTGYVVQDRSIAASMHVAAGLALQDVVNQFSTKTYQTTFVFGNTIGCIATIPLNTTPFFVFYRPHDLPDQPSVSLPQNSTVCVPLDGASQDCYASSPITLSDAGAWKCELRLFNSTKNMFTYLAQPTLEMFNGAPSFNGKFSPITLTQDGTLPDNSTFDLRTYFTDPDGQPLQYAIKPTKRLSVTVSAAGIVTFANPQNFSGTELIYFSATDGTETAYSPPLFVTIGTPSSTPVNVSGCAPLWDCTEWGICTEKIKHRVCTDRNSCSSSDGKPVEQQECSAAATTTPANSQAQRDLHLSEQDLGTIEEKTVITPFHIAALSIGILCLLTGGGLFLWQKRNAQKKSPVQPAAVPLSKIQPAAQQSPPLKNTSSPAQSPSPAPQQAQPPSSLQTYTNTMIVTNRKPAAEVYAILEKTGWKKELIEPAISRAQLTLFITDKQAQGFPKETIRATLIAKGWDTVTVDQLLHEIFTR